MINNDKTYRCACNMRSQRHSFTADTSGKHILMTDPERSTLLQDTTWFVAPIQRGNPSKFHARAASRAPGIKKGRLLHRLALKMRHKKRKVRAINGNLLDVRSSNLQTCTASDIRILNRAKPVRKLVGVHHAVPPQWLKTDCVYHASITVGGVKLHLGSFRTLEEAGCCFDAAAKMVHGPNATTNQSLGFISAKVARIKVCRKAAKAARRKVKEHRLKEALEKMQAFESATTQEERRVILRSMLPVPTVGVTSYAKDNAQSGTL